MAMIFALSVVDFSMFLQVEARWWRGADHFVEVVVRRADMQEDFGKRAHIRRGPPRIFLGGDGFRQVCEFVRLHHHLRDNFRAVAAHPGCAFLLRIHVARGGKHRNGNHNETQSGHGAFHPSLLFVNWL